MLDVSSDSKGFLPPRLTIVQRDQITDPAPGLIIYNANDNCLNYFNGIEWVEFGRIYYIPEPDFTGTPTVGMVPLSVSFTDQTTYNPTDWVWEFGDGGTSTEQNPTYTYNYPGVYSVKLTAINSNGTDSIAKEDYVVVGLVDMNTPCPEMPTVTDVDGNEYNTVQIGDQCWMKENLKVSKYADGTEIDHVQDASGWSGLSYASKAYCYNNNEPSSDYGYLYTWGAATNGINKGNYPIVQGICPDGWHVPSNSEYSILFNYLGGSIVAGGWMKEAENLHWNNPNLGASNLSGFSALGGGYRNNDGSFLNFRSLSRNWISEQAGSSMGYFAYLTNSSTTAKNYTSYYKNLGISVRCIKNTEDAPEVYFSADTTFGNPPCEIVFTDLSSNNPTVWEWDFGDGFTSTIQNPSHTYNDIGLYTVILKAYNGGGLSTEVKEDYIQVDGLPTSNFSSDTNYGEAPFTVSFFDESLSTSTFSWQWDFGDGNTSTDVNPTHTYDSIGDFNVTLTIENQYGTDSETKVNFISVVPVGFCPDEVVDIDGNEYSTVLIGSQCWMRENLKVTKYPNGDDIPNVTDNSAWAELVDNNNDDAYCFYNNDANSIYGALYSYAAAIGDNWERDNTDGQGICPDGWHLPTDEEWKILEGTVDTQYPVGDPEWNDTGYRGYDVGTHLKSTGGWYNSGNGDNSSGFTALPGGYRSNSNGWFYSSDESGYWWSTTESSSGDAWYRGLRYYKANVHRYDIDKSDGNSVRCTRDN
jgi:uncharacterized protein (TIGR02145 family)